MPKRNMNDGIGGREYVNGRNITMLRRTVSPGMAPNTIPKKSPMFI